MQYSDEWVEGIPGECLRSVVHDAAQVVAEAQRVAPVPASYTAYLIHKENLRIALHFKSFQITQQFRAILGVSAKNE